VTLEAGQKAPEFDLPTDGGGRVRLADLKGRPLVLYFYPKDDTPGCTKEEIDFARSHPEFAAAGIAIVGVSKDSVASHDSFKAKHELPLRARFRRIRRGGRGLWQLSREEHVRQELHGHRALDLPGRRPGHGPSGLAQGPGAGPCRRRPGGSQEPHLT
jgi:hypothetical protein